MSEFIGTIFISLGIASYMASFIKDWSFVYIGVVFFMIGFFLYPGNFFEAKEQIFYCVETDHGYECSKKAGGR